MVIYKIYLNFICRCGDQALRASNVCLPWMAIYPQHAATYLVEGRPTLLYPKKVVKAICAKLPVTNNFKSRTGLRADDEHLVKSKVNCM